MASGETLLKLTDYPFAYSFVGIISVMIGFSLGQNQLIFLGIAGAVGTFLTIVDPIGVGLRKNAENRIRKASKKKKLDNMEIQFKLSSLKSKSISYEMEKIIGMFYFVIIISLFMLAVFLPTPFFEKLIILDGDKEPLCSEWCFKFSYLGLSLSALIIISEKGRKFWRELDKKVDIAADHMAMINDDNATQTSVESMTRAVEQNDWELAELWSHKIEDEILNNKGKRELIIKAADMVFSKLHGEGVDFENNLKSMRWTRLYQNFDSKEWLQIKKHSQQSIIEDTVLRKRIEKFYSLMHEYNESIGHVNRRIHAIINERLSEVYRKTIVGISFDMESGRIDLLPCVISNTHPLKYEPEKGNLKVLQLQIKKGTSSEFTEFHDTKLFDESWKLIIKDAENDELIKTIRSNLETLKIENPKLQKIYSDKIEMQWNV